MSDVLEVSITRSVNAVHVGDDFLLYITVRNGYAQPITELAVTHDLPKGLLIPESVETPRGWLRSIAHAFLNFLYMPSIPSTSFESRRRMKWAVEVLPGESYTINMPLRAGAFLPPLLKPDTYHLVFHVDFTYAGQEHSLCSRTDLVVYPHPAGVYLGAIIGGGIGSAYRQQDSSASILHGLAFGALSGLLLAVIFRRKTNVQSFIAVEDFWGGLLIGFTAGYAGHEALDRYLLPAKGNG